MDRRRSALVLAGLAWLGLATPAVAQPLGTFRWQLAPFCNVLTLSVQQVLTAFVLVGADDQCGATPPAAVVGTAVLQPDGTARFGLTLVGPSGVPAHTEATVHAATLLGTWRDGEGNTGDFLPSPPGSPAGPARPAPVAAGGALGPGVVTPTLLASGAVTTAALAPGAVDAARIAPGAIGAAQVNPSEVQRRVSGTCPAGQFVQAVAADGTVTCTAEPTVPSLQTRLTAVETQSPGGLTTCTDGQLPKRVGGAWQCALEGARAVGPVVLDMPAAIGGLTRTTLLANGPLTLVGECENAAGVPRARVGVQHAVEMFQFPTLAGGKVVVFPVTFPLTTRTIVEVTATGGLPVWDARQAVFAAIPNPFTGQLVGLQGTATAITESGFGVTRCYLAAAAGASP